MEVRACGSARGANTADSRARPNALTSANGDAGKVGVQRAHPSSVAEPHTVAVAARVPARPHDAAGSGGANRPPVWGGEIDTGVEAVPTRPEEIAEGCADRAREGIGSARTWPVQRRVGRRARDAVTDEMAPTLKAAERGRRARTEPAVEGSAGETVGRERELERRDVPAGPPSSEEARSEAMASVPSQRTARLRTDDAVHDEALPPLEAPYGSDSFGTPNAVDRAGVEPSSLERHLERSRPASGEGGGRRGESEEDDG
jgi:hypothetical protein